MRKKGILLVLLILLALVLLCSSCAWLRADPKTRGSDPLGMYYARDMKEWYAKHGLRLRYLRDQAANGFFDSPAWKERLIQDDRTVEPVESSPIDEVAIAEEDQKIMEDYALSEFLAKIASGQFVTTFSLTYGSRNIWNGFDWFANDHSMIQPGIDLDLFGTGFGMNILWSGANGSGMENRQWLVYNPYYYNSLWDGEGCQTNYRFGWRYYDSPNGDIDEDFGRSRDADFQEFHGLLSWPRVAPEGIVPFYEFSRIWPDKGGRFSSGDQKSFWRTYGGWFHTIGAYKDWDLSGWRTGTDTGSGFRRIRTSAEMVYNDGAGPTADADRDGADHDWSHGVLRAEAEFVFKTWTVTP